MRFSRRFAISLVAVTLAVPGVARAQSNPIDDLIKLSTDAFNDLNYKKADSVARSVLLISAATPAQRARAQMVIAASAYPDDPSAQKRAAALATLKQLVKVNYGIKLPQELTWPGLDSLLDEAKRTTFALQVTAETQQTAVGVDGTAKIHLKSNKTGLFRLVIAAKSGNDVAVVDSLMSVSEGDITFKTMRDEKPIFSSGDYSVTVTGFEPGGRGDTVTVQYALKVDAPPIVPVTLPTKMDSSKLLKTRSGKSGAKSIFPALLVGGATFALSSVLRGEGNIATQGPAADSKGVAVGGGMALFTIVAGFMDHGRAIPANIAANKAAGEAFQKSIADAQAENRRRITEYKTVLTFDLEAK
jgi:hypothetical protein